MRETFAYEPEDGPTQGTFDSREAAIAAADAKLEPGTRFTLVRMPGRIGAGHREPDHYIAGER